MKFSNDIYVTERDALRIDTVRRRDGGFPSQSAAGKMPAFPVRDGVGRSISLN